MKSLLAAFLAFLGPVAGSVKGFLNSAEIGRALLAGSSASTVLGFSVAFLSTIGTDATAATTASASIGVAAVAFVAVHAADLLRRLQQASPPAK
jgi:hypothetical protein